MTDHSADEDGPQFLYSLPTTASTTATADKMAEWLGMSASAAVLLKELANIRSTLDGYYP